MTAYEMLISDWSSDVCSSDLKGTVIGARPAKEYSDVGAIAALTNPREVMQARLLIEPQIAREAALNATAGDIGELTQCMLASRHAQTRSEEHTSELQSLMRIS